MEFNQYSRPKLPRNKYDYVNQGGGTTIIKSSGGGSSSSTTITYSEFVGASQDKSGSNGLVPAPSAGQQGTYLCGNGNWESFVDPDWYSKISLNSAGDGIKITGKFEVTSDTRLNNLDVDGNSNLNNGMSVTYDGDTKFEIYDNIYAYSNTYVNADLTVKNDLTVQKDLTVTGYTYLGNFSAGSALVSYIHDTGKLYVDGGTYTHYIKNTGNIENTGDIYNRSGDIITKNLTVTGQAHFFELVIDKIKSVGGAAMFTPADGFTVYSYNYNSNDNTYTLYWDNKQGNGANMWEVGDQALCMNFKQAKVGTSYSVANKYWWSLVTDKGLSGSGNYAYITISNTTYAGNINIAEGDDVVMCGHRQQISESADVARQRGSAIYIAAANSLDTYLTAPLYAQYRGINNFDLASHRYSYFDARNAEFIGSFKVSSEKSIEDYIDEQIDEKSDTTISLVCGTNNVTIATDKDGKVPTAGSITFELALYKGNTMLTGGEYSSKGFSGFSCDEENYPYYEFEWDDDQSIPEQKNTITVTAYDSDGVKYTRNTIVQVTPVKQGNTGSGTGTKGDDGYTVNANPESLIYNANDYGIVSNTAAREPIITLSVLKGNDDITERCDFGTPITYNCTVSFDSDNNPGIYQIWTIGTQYVPNSTDENKVQLSYTAGSFTVPISYTYNSETIHLTKTIPFSVNINRYIGGMEVNSKEFKTEFTNYKTTTDGTLEKYYSKIQENASAISLKVGRDEMTSYATSEQLLDTGIDITNKQIKLTSDNLICQNNAGDKTMWLDAYGNLMVTGTYANQVQEINTSTSKNTHLLIDGSAEIEEVSAGTLYGVTDTLNLTSLDSIYALDVLGCSNVLRITACDRDVVLPFYINSDHYIRTATRFGTGNLHMITNDEMKQLIGKKIIIFVECNPQHSIYYGPSFKAATENGKDLMTWDAVINGTNYVAPNSTDEYVAMRMSQNYTYICELALGIYGGSVCYYWKVTNAQNSTLQMSGDYGNIDW